MRQYNEDIPKYGDLMTLQDFQEAVDCGMFTDYDGHGYYVKDNKMSRSNVWNEKPEDATHVMWFNR